MEGAHRHQGARGGGRGQCRVPRVPRAQAGEEVADVPGVHRGELGDALPVEKGQVARDVAFVGAQGMP